MKGYRKVLIAVNGRKEVLDQGLRLADDESTWVTVVKVIPPNEGELNLTAIKNLDDVLDSDSRKERGAIRTIADDRKMLVKTRVEEGSPHEKILEVAEEERCDLIIMGARKRNWLRALFGDHTVERVIRRAPCPVLVV